MQTLIIVIGLASAVIVFLLIPALFGRDDSPTPFMSDSDDSRHIVASPADNKIEKKQVESAEKDNQAKGPYFITRLIWIASISAAALLVYYIASPYQNCLAKSDKNWCSQHTIW